MRFPFHLINCVIKSQIGLSALGNILITEAMLPVIELRPDSRFAQNWLEDVCRRTLVPTESCNQLMVAYRINPIVLMVRHEL